VVRAIVKLSLTYYNLSEKSVVYTYGMRIIGGELKGRVIATPKNKGMRPMTDRDRESLFNILGDISGSKVLDAYAGSGAMGLEALSRGASYVDGIELSKALAGSIKKNVAALGISAKYKLYPQKIETWLEQNQSPSQYDLIFADPPFDQLKAIVLEKLGTNLKMGGLLVIKHSSQEVLSQTLGVLHVIDSRRYGDTAITFYRKG
jgi:16S rRNA (guanine966-N2)-methyltransferase